jgi:hypothetical protein
LRSRIEERTALKVSGTFQKRLIARAHCSPISLSRNISHPTPKRPKKEEVVDNAVEKDTKKKNANALVGKAFIGFYQGVT